MSKCAKCGHAKRVHLAGLCCASRYMKNDQPACECSGYEPSEEGDDFLARQHALIRWNMEVLRQRAAKAEGRNQ